MNWLFFGCNSKTTVEDFPFVGQLVDTSFTCNCKAKVEPFNLDQSDTMLSGGYHLKYYYDYSVEDSFCLQGVDLMMGTERIKQINSFDYRFHHGRLGWLEADFGDRFVFVEGILSMPNLISFFEKKTGNKLLKGFFHKRENDVILYSTFENNIGHQELRIFDDNNNNDFEIVDFLELDCKWDEEWFGDCIELDSVSDSRIWISMMTENNKITKTYKR